MAFTIWYPMFGGESQSSDAEVLNQVRTSDCTVDTTAAGISSGIRCVKFPTNTAAHKAILPVGGLLVTTFSDRIFMFSGSIMVASGLTSEVGLLSNATVDDARFVRIGTDYKFYFYTSTGTLLRGCDRPLVAGTASRFAIQYDFVSCGTSLCHITLWLDNKWVDSFLVPTTNLLPSNISTLCWGEWAAATARGADMYGDDLTARATATATADPLVYRDAAWLTPYPVLRMVGGASLPPAAAGTHAQWSNEVAGTATFAAVADYPADLGPGNDQMNEGTVSEKVTFKYTAANPFDTIGAATVDSVNHRWVSRLAGSKTGFGLLLRDAAGNESNHNSTVPGTSYVGYSNDAGTYKLSRPAGGTWVTTDFALAAGVSDYQFGAQASSVPTPSPNITMLTGPEITYWTEVLEAGRYPGR